MLVNKSCSLTTSDLQFADVSCTLHANPSFFQLLGSDFNTSLHVERRDLCAGDLVLAELANARGPPALLRAPADDAASQQTLLQLSGDLLTCGQLLVLPGSTDMVLLPRQAADTDGVPFLVFLTHVAGVELMASLVHTKRVGLILDLDATLLESEMLDDTTKPANWYNLPWRQDTFRSSSGEAVPGFLAPLPSEEGAESVHAVSWVKDGLSHNYRVRVRPGWSQLKSCLVQGREKFHTTVCSLGRTVYVQAVCNLLDPANEIIPRADYPERVVSARPDGTYGHPDKTPALGLGLVPPLAADYNMRFAPLIAVDDIPEYYPESYRDTCYRIEPYKPTCKFPSSMDSGDALSVLADTLRDFWSNCYGTGNGGAIGRLKLCAAELLQKLQEVPIEDAGWLMYCDFLFISTGAQCWATLSLESLLQHQADQADILARSLQETVVPHQPSAVENTPENTVDRTRPPSKLGGAAEGSHFAAMDTAGEPAAAVADGGLPMLAAACLIEVDLLEGGAADAFHVHVDSDEEL